MKRNMFISLLIGIFFANHLQNVRADILDNWTTDVIAVNSDAIDCIVYGNGCFVATAEYFDSGSIYTSLDGVNWTLQFHGLTGWGTALNFANGRFVGVGGYGNILISTDGTNWTGGGIPLGLSDRFGDITYGNGLYVKVGSTDGVGNIYTSTDGSNWTPQDIYSSAQGYISSVAYGTVPPFFPSTKPQPLFVALGDNDGNSYFSPDGTNWTQQSISGGNVISFGNGLFIVPLNNNSNLVSSDGIDWSMLNTGLTNQLGRVTWSSGLFLAFAANYLATSIDGTNWFQYPNIIPNGHTGYGYNAYYSTFATDGKQLVTFSNATGDAYPPVTNNAFAYLSGPLVGIRMTNGLSGKVALSGLVGRNYQVQSVDTLGANNNWQTNVTVQLTNTPFIWTDSTATNSTRFYRGVLLP